VGQPPGGNAFNDYATRNHFNLLHKDEVGGRVRRSRPTQTPAATALSAEQKVTEQADEAAKAEAAAQAEAAKAAAQAEQKAAEQAEAVKRAAPFIEAVKTIVLMELPTAFDKPLGDLNEAEGHQLAGWQASLFKGIGNSKLRDVKSEPDLQAAWKFWRAAQGVPV
jgi:hypothetical protein